MLRNKMEIFRLRGTIFSLLALSLAFLGHQCGWTLQESLLSPRTLSYGFRHMSWECQKCKVDKTGRPILPGERYRDKKFLQSFFTGKLSLGEQSVRNLTKFSLKVMSLITKEFTSRNLTVHTDVLPALSGLARAFQEHLDDQYCDGLWKKDIIRDLVWIRVVPSNRSLSDCQTRKRIENYRVPSWSWASIKGGKLLNHLAEEELSPYIDLDETAKALEVSMTLRLADSLGQTSDGYIVLQAPYCSIKDPLSKDQNISPTKDPVLESYI